MVDFKCGRYLEDGSREENNVAPMRRAIQEAISGVRRWWEEDYS